MELHEALGQIEAIHRQMARTEKFRCYTAWPTAIGALLAVAAAGLQSILLPHPEDDLNFYLVLWLGVAAVAGIISAGDAWRRHRRDASASGILVRLACEQFLPCIVAGALLTAAIARGAPTVAWMLPGLWAVVFSLGLFASLRLLPGPIVAAAVWYLIAGCVCLAVGPTHGGLRPWTMAVLFGVGQAMLAGVLAMQPDDYGATREDDRGV